MRVIGLGRGHHLGSPPGKALAARINPEERQHLPKTSFLGLSRRRISFGEPSRGFGALRLLPVQAYRRV